MAAAVREAESGVPVAEICSRLGITEVTFLRWKKFFDGMGDRDAEVAATRGRETQTQVPGCRLDLVTRRLNLPHTTNQP